jgi:hypothetical protein
VSLCSALWRAGDILRICPTMNCFASALICPAPQGEDAPGFTAYGRSSALRALLTCGSMLATEEVLGVSVEVRRHRRGLCLRGDDAAHGEAVGPCQAVFGRYL